MKCLVVVALVVGLTFPASGLLAMSHSSGGGGSHGGGGHSGGFSRGSSGGGSASHGGFSGGSSASSSARSPVSSPGRFSSHPAPGFSSGYRPAAPGRFASAPRYAGNMRPEMPMGAARNSGNRPAYTGLNSARRSPYRPPYGPGRHGYRQPYNTAVVYEGGPWIGAYGGWYGYDSLDYPDGSADDDGASTGYANPNYADPDYAGPTYTDTDPGPGTDSAPQAYPPAYPRQQSSPAPKSPGEQAVTLVFKDGRPAEQIHNYILTRTTLSVLNQKHRDIPVDELDLPATEKLNRAVGIDFRLPQ